MENDFLKCSPQFSTPKVLLRLLSESSEWKKTRSRKTMPTPPISSIRLRYSSRELGRLALFDTKLNPVVVNPEMLSK